MRPLTPQEKELALKLREETFNEEERKKLLGIKKFRRGLSGKDLFLDWIFAPEIAITGFHTGYMGPGFKEFFPNAASAKLIIRLQPNQDPKDILWKLRKHLNTHGFPEVEIHVRTINAPVRPSVKNPIAQAAIRAVKRHGCEPII